MTIYFDSGIIDIPQDDTTVDNGNGFVISNDGVPTVREPSTVERDTLGQIVVPEEPEAPAPVEETSTSTVVETTPEGDSGTDFGQIIGFVLLGVLGLMILSGVSYGAFRGIRAGWRASHKRKQQMREYTSQWQSLLDRHALIESRWLEYETDIAKLIDFPLMSDPTSPLTAQFHQKMSSARLIRPKSASDKSSEPAYQSDYAHAVENLELSFAQAENEAKRTKWTLFSGEERKRLALAQRYLKIAYDSGSSDFERQTAYKQAMKAIENLIIVPEVAIAELLARTPILISAH
jgi:hypothetical protein